jgi:hypothetical protein
MRVMRRAFPRYHSLWHPHAHGTAGCGRPAGGGFLTVSLTPQLGPFGKVTQPGGDHPYQGMDPSDPATWTRPYNPQPGMISYLNRDGAQPNPAGGVQRGPQGLFFWPGGVPGSSVNNG